METFEKTSRPLRIAIDISIWQFQVQSAKGGSNPALRTLYYRLLRLLSLSIQPLFIFDGPNKPPFKRNVRTSPHTASMPNMLAKQLLKLFGFPFLSAPGEAEAECAILQREGIVDMVLSEDVDTMMFGCNKTIRNWSSEGTRGNKSPTHISLYEGEKIKNGKSGLDREGMVLIALMSGGDYIPAGIPGCGIKIASEAAKAGFGSELCKLSKKDVVGIRQWRERLEYELRTNESGYFRIRHKSLRVPDKFPDKAVLGYYTHPMVSSHDQLLNLQKSIKWSGMVDVKGLREFVAEAFEWQNISGARKLIRGLAPALLVHKISQREERSTSNNESIEDQALSEAQHIKSICGRRRHFMTDGIPELRVIYVPSDIVNLDLAQEGPDMYEGVGSDNSDDEVLDSSQENKSCSRGLAKQHAPPRYDPTKPEKIWIMETFAKYGTPLTVENWEEDMRNPKKFATRKLRERNVVTKCGMKKGAMEAFIRVAKPGVQRCHHNDEINNKSTEFLLDSQHRPVYVVPNLEPEIQTSTTIMARIEKDKLPKMQRCKNRAPKAKQTRTREAPVEQLPRTPPPKNNEINPWSLSRRPKETFDVQLASTKRYSALGIYGQCEMVNEASHSSMTANHSNDQQSSSPLNSPSANKQSRSLSTTSDGHDDPEDEFYDQDNLFRSPGAMLRVSDPLGTSEQVSKPSVREKMVPPETFDSCHLAQQVGTPDLDEHESDVISPLQVLTSQCGNRRPKFFSPFPLANVSEAATSPSLLSSSKLVSLNQNDRLRGEKKLVSAQRSCELPEPRRLRRFISVRDSLEGAWKEVDQWYVEVAGAKNVYQGVEVIDLA